MGIFLYLIGIVQAQGSSAPAKNSTDFAAQERIEKLIEQLRSD